MIIQRASPSDERIIAYNEARKIPLPAGLTATCKDLLNKAKPEGAGG
jgi:hypothetical protein